MRGLKQGSAALAVLDDDLRKRMYLFIRAQSRPVSRDEAAAEAAGSPANWLHFT